jgi:hypothetical protein
LEFEGEGQICREFQSDGVESRGALCMNTHADANTPIAIIPAPTVRPPGAATQRN